MICFEGIFLKYCPMADTKAVKGLCCVWMYGNYSVNFSNEKKSNLVRKHLIKQILFIASGIPKCIIKNENN